MAKADRLDTFPVKLAVGFTESGELHVEVTLGGEFKGVHLSLPLWMFQHLLYSLQELGLETTQHVVTIGMSFDDDADEEKMVRRTSEVYAFVSAVDQIRQEQQWNDSQDPLYTGLYDMLRSGLIRAEEARDIAAQALGVSQLRVGTPDAFRKRLDRWAGRRNLPKIGQTKRKPRSL